MRVTARLAAVGERACSRDPTRAALRRRSDDSAAPDALIATHATGGVVDNDPANWVAENFTCLIGEHEGRS